MLILIEGIDRTGKTTLAGATGLEVHHRGPPGEFPTLLHHGEHLADFRSGDQWVLDRNHWSDLAYGPIYHPDNVLGELGVLYLDLVLEARGGVSVLGWADRGTSAIHDRMREHGEAYLQPKDVDSVWEVFNEIVHRTVLPVWRWDYEDPDISGLPYMFKILAHAEERAGEVHLALSLAPEAVGWTVLPTHLIVGDRVEGSDQHNEWGFQLPFAPVLGTSGQYLWEHLSRSIYHKQHPRRPLVVNAVDSTGRLIDLYSLWHALGSPPTVALGNAANDALTMQQVPHGAVPHPQYVRRFKHRHGTRYVQALYRAAKNEGDLRPWIQSL